MAHLLAWTGMYKASKLTKLVLNRQEFKAAFIDLNAAFFWLLDGLLCKDQGTWMNAVAIILKA